MWWAFHWVSVVEGSSLSPNWLNWGTMATAIVQLPSILYICIMVCFQPEPRSASCTCRVTQAVLKTLTGYLDWVTTPVIIDHNGLLLQFFCLMLSEERLQLDAAECLLLVTSRKVRIQRCHFSYFFRISYFLAISI